MKEYSSKVAQNAFGGVLKEVLKGAVQVTKNGKPYAVIISVRDYQDLVRFNDGYWEKVASESLSEGFLGDEGMVQWLAERLKIQLHYVEAMVLPTQMNADDNTICFELCEPIVKVSNQVQTFMTSLRRDLFVKLFNNIMKHKGSTQDDKESEFNQHDYGKIRVVYDYQNKSMRLLHMGGR